MERSRASTERRGHSPLLWLNLTCFDAPLVAVSWLWLFARSCGIAIAIGGTVALFLTAWLIYLVDRFGDSLSLKQRATPSQRQSFCSRHWLAWLGAIALIAGADLVVIAHTLESRMALAGAAVGTIACAYLIVNRTLPALWQLVPLKELTIGFLFAAGTMVPLAHALTSAMLPAWLFFAFLCSLNCVSIAVWERELDEAQARISIATAFPLVGRCLLAALLLLATASDVLSIAATTGRSLFVCIGATSVLLATVHVCRDEIQADVRTALADLVLLTPMFALLI